MEAAAPARRLAGRHVLDELIATGGMAEVWRGHDQVLARTVAVKILQPELARDARLAERFGREAVSAARLTHPGIISVFDTGVEDGIHYIVMEFFEGGSLRRVMEERGPMEIAEAAPLILPVLSALAFAHAAGVIHRDIKPSNILVADDGHVKVADFGIAKAVQTDGDPTTTGVVFGTARYLSPEQVTGATVDARSDLYSVGVVLYEMLTRRPPFAAQTDLATAMMRLTSDPVAPRSLRPDIPRAAEAVVLRAMARNRDRRFPSAEVMRAALERVAEDGGSSTAPIGARDGATAGATAEHPTAARPTSAFRSWMLIPLLVIAVAVLLLGAGFALGRLEFGGPLGVQAAPKSGATTALTALPVVEVRDYDPPPGDGSENSFDIGFIVDGDPTTAWRTSHYTTAAFGNLKQGVGIWLDLAGRVEVHRVVIRSPLAGWTFELRRGSPSSGLGQPLAGSGGATTFTADPSGRTVVDVAPVDMSGLFIWITGLATDDGQFAAAIGEVVVEGRGRQER